MLGETDALMLGNALREQEHGLAIRTLDGTLGGEQVQRNEEYK